jgi:hypothetical protein
MLKDLKLSQIQLIALLSKAASQERNAVMRNFSEKNTGEPGAAHGEHNEVGSLGLEVLGDDSPQIVALRDEIEKLPFAALHELYGLMRIGQSDFAPRDWDQAIDEATRLGTMSMVGTLLDDANLHEHLTKALYEMDLAV